MSADDRSNEKKISLVESTAIAVASAAGPAVGLGAALLGTARQIFFLRANLFYEDLIELNIDPAAERVRTQDELEAAIATMQRVHHATHREKIKMFAKLYSAYEKTSTFESVDHYEESLSRLEQLSIREWQILLILDRHEKACTQHPSRSLQRTMIIWEAFAAEVHKTLRITEGDLRPMLTGIARSGLYENFPTAFNEEPLGKGRLTPLFDKFVDDLKAGEGPYVKSHSSVARVAVK